MCLMLLPVPIWRRRWRMIQWPMSRLCIYYVYGGRPLAAPSAVVLCNSSSRLTANAFFSPCTYTEVSFHHHFINIALESQMFIVKWVNEKNKRIMFLFTAAGWWDEARVIAACFRVWALLLLVRHSLLLLLFWDI